jgi:hypothetical protein
MIAWIECSGRRPYLAAIVDSVEEATRLLADIPQQIAIHRRVKSRVDLTRPCFIVEGDNGFVFCSREEAEAAIAAHLKAESLDDEDRRVTLYHIVEPFIPTEAGRDEMGLIRHTHPGAVEAARIAKEGLASAGFA